MASPQNRGLGKGLSVLLSEEYSASVTEKPGQGAPGALPVTGIVSGKYQPRTRFSQEYLAELAASIRANGVMQPIVVRPSREFEGKYEIVAGERRWRAARLAELETIPAIIRDIPDQQALEMALVENIQRQDLSPLEEAAGYQRLIDEFHYTQEQLGQTVGKSRSHIANLLRLLALPEKIKKYLEEGQLSMGHARALLGAVEPEALADDIVRRGLNVRQTEELCRASTGQEATPRPRKSSPAAGGGRSAAQPARDKDPDILALEETLSENLGLSVSIEDRGQSGRIVLTYESLTQLDEILRRLGGGA